MKIIVGGIDPSLRNTGLAKGVYDTETRELVITNLLLIETENEAGKQVRKNSDDLRACAEILGAMHIFIADCDVVFAEMPTGGQSASASKAFGACIGMLASVGVVGRHQGKLVEVQPTEVKKAATGSKHATKDEMIAWAMNLWPKAPWMTRRLKGEIVPLAKNEHLADACGAINAGLQTNQFKTLVSMLLSIQRVKS